MFKTIIVGVDAREGGRDALALGNALARLTGGELVAVHAYPYDYHVSRGGSAGFDAAMLDAAKETLEGELELTGDVAAGTLHAAPCPVLVTTRVAAKQEPDAAAVGEAVGLPTETTGDPSRIRAASRDATLSS